VGNNIEWIRPVLEWMESTWLNEFALGPRWNWPILETLHFIGMCLLFGPIIVMDLRLLGFERLSLAPAAIHKLIPLTVAGFVLNLSTGIIFLFGNPFRYAMNISFVIKMWLVLIAGINALYFWRKVTPLLERLGPHEDPPAPIKLVGLVSLVSWTGVLCFGRLIPYLGTG
jgi:hypothetical protein